MKKYLYLSMAFFFLSISISTATASSELSFTSSEEFHFFVNDGGWMAFNKAPSFSGIIRRDYGLTDNVRSLDLHKLSDSTSLQMNESLCLSYLYRLHGIENPDNQDLASNLNIPNPEFYSSRSGQVCEARVLSREEHPLIRETIYHFTVIKGQLYGFVYNSRSLIRDSEKQDVRSFIQSLK